MRTLQQNQTALSGHLKYENSFQQAHHNTMVVASVKSAKTIVKNPVLNGAVVMMKWGFMSSDVGLTGNFVVCGFHMNSF